MVPIYYWNEANFEGLKQLAEALESDSKLSKLAEYCRLRERGSPEVRIRTLRRCVEKVCLSKEDGEVEIQLSPLPVGGPWSIGSVSVRRDL